MNSCFSPLFDPPLPKEAPDRLKFGNLSHDSVGLLISRVAKKAKTLLLVITPDNLSAVLLEEALSFFAPELKILHFPDWETLPYDNFSPHQDLVAQRLSTLAQLLYLPEGILLVPINTLMQRIAPATYVQANSLLFSLGEKINRDALRRKLESSGYYNVSQVLHAGEFAIRGSLLDVFPLGSEKPYRIDLVDEEIESIRTFDLTTQRSLNKISKINLLPAREFPLTEGGIALFRQNWRSTFAGNPLHNSLYESVSQGICPAGIDYYLPLFFESTHLLTDFLPENSVIIQLETIKEHAHYFWKEINERYEQLRHNREKPILAPSVLYSAPENIFAQINKFSKIVIQTSPVESKAGQFNFPTLPFPDLRLETKNEQPLVKLLSFLNSVPSEGSVLFCAESPGRREVLLDLLKTAGIFPHVCESFQDFCERNLRFNIITAFLKEGLYLTDAPYYVLIAESQLMGHQITQRRKKKGKNLDANAVIRHLAELTVGTPVVHFDHGVGRYLGLEILTINDYEAEFLIIEYAQESRLYVPVSSLELISRYQGGDSEHIPLSRLGTDHWDKAKRKTVEQLKDVAAELLDVYAERAARQGFAFHLPEENYQIFANAFPFEETVDQEKAIKTVIADMLSVKPMDRLICGDVGFGKTEVAMRAAFIAVQNGKQVVILVPTTLLAQQHYHTFTDRFADWPVIIDVLSRFRSPQEQKNIIERLKNGKIDIIIGTHKLLNKLLVFKELGLLIIDEEHRFGVQQKERLKELRHEVDILTLTATPIPRTLNMALAGLRELSIIATPPARRLSIKTFIQEYDSIGVREAILRELLRGGQIYFLHNEVTTIEKTATHLQTLVPQARIAIAHGQMREKELEQIMADFYHQRFNVLVCTTIIETGIDIPTANTILINRADKLGLAQLHQLRGRVGRSHHQAYAYLLIPHKKFLSADAVKRLEALSSLEDLGAGFMLASHDLEIRGAGEVLGENQSGNIHTIGFSLYMELLEQTIEAIKSGKEPSLTKIRHKNVEIDLQIAGLIPEIYVGDVHIRLVFYKRIANIESLAGLQDLQIEMIDRFGLLPEPTKNLFRMAELKLLGKTLGIKKIEAGAAGGRIEFEEHPSFNTTALIRMIQQFPSNYKLEGPTKLRFIISQISAEERIKNVEKLLIALHL